MSMMMAEIQYPESFTDLDADLYRRLVTEVQHLHKRNADILKENEELLQKTQIVVNRVETQIVEHKPGMEKEAVEKITDLEAKLDQAVYEIEIKVKEIEDLQKITTRMHDLEAKLDSLEGENKAMKTELDLRLNEIGLLRKEKFELNQLNQKYILDLADRNREIEDLMKKLKDLEIMPDLLYQAKKDNEVLTLEVERLTALTIGKDGEIENLKIMIEMLKTERCLAPAEHDELKIKIAEIAALNERIAYLALLQDVVKDLEAENQRILLQLKEREADNGQLKLRIEEIVKTIDRLNEEVGLRDITISELEKQKTKIVIEVERIRVESTERYEMIVLEKDANIAELTRQLLEQSKEIELLRKEMAKLVEDFNAAVIERENLLKILNSRDSQISSLTESLAIAEEQIKKFMCEVEESSITISTIENQNKDFVVQINALGAERQGFLIKIAELEEQRKLLEVITIQRDTLLAEIRELSLQNEGLVNKVSKLQLELENANGRIEETTIVLEKITLERDTRITEIQDWTLRFNELLAERSRLLEVIKEKDMIISDLSRLRDGLQSKIVVLDESILILQHDKDDLAVRFEATKSENHRLLKMVDVLTTEKEHGLSLIEQRDNLVAALNRDIVRLSDENKELVQNVMAKEEQCNGQKSILLEREIEIEKLKKIVDKMSPEIDSLTEKTKFYAAEFNKIEYLNKAQDGELNGLREQLRFTEELRVRAEELTQQNAEMKYQLHELDRIRSELVRTQQQLAVVISERDKLIEVIRDREGEIKNLRFVSQEYEDLRIRFRDNEIEFEKLRSVLKNKGIFISELESKIANLEGIIESQNKFAFDNEMLTKDLATMTSRCQKLEYNVTVTNEKYKKLEVLYEEIRGMTEKLGRVHEKLENAVEETERVNESLKSTEVYQQKIVTEKEITHVNPQRF